MSTVSRQGFWQTARHVGNYALSVAQSQTRATPLKSSQTSGAGFIVPDTKKFPVIEIFGPTVQGEGRDTGRPVHFLRLGGCDFRCSWCDTPHAVLPEQVRENKTMMTAHDIMDALNALEGNPRRLIISGGNPAMHDCTGLLSLLRRNKYHVAVETQGSVFKPWLLDVDLLTLSPKPPSSGMNLEKNYAVLDRIIAARRREKRPIDLKIVAFDDADLEYAKTIFRRHGSDGDMVRHFLSLGTLVGTDTRDAMLDRLRTLVEQGTRSEAFAQCTFSCQMHVLLWGHIKGV